MAAGSRFERRSDAPSSLAADGLDAHVAVAAPGPARDGHVQLHVTVANTGTDGWLLSPTAIGRVNVGVQVLDDADRVVQQDYERVALLPARTRPVPPGATVTFDIDLPVPPAARRLGVQMVSEGVAWFGEVATVDLTPASG